MGLFIAKQWLKALIYKGFFCYVKGRRRLFMKKLVLSLLVMSVGSVFAQPVAQNAQIAALAGSNMVNSSLLPYVQGGNPPYMFQINQAVNATVALNPNSGDFSATITDMPSSFQYTVTDVNGDSSAPATITLFGNIEKG